MGGIRTGPALLGPYIKEPLYFLTCIHDLGSLVDAGSVVICASQVVGHDRCGAALANAHLEAGAAEQQAPLLAVLLGRPELQRRLWPIRIHGAFLDRQAPEQCSLYFTYRWGGKCGAWVWSRKYMGRKL